LSDPEKREGMSEKQRDHRLLEAAHVSITYAIVDRDTLAVRPLADELLASLAQRGDGTRARVDVEREHQPAMHLVQLRTTRPVKKLGALRKKFDAEVGVLNAWLKPHNAMLLPTGAHPLMVPAHETVLWPHEHAARYTLQDRLFDRRTHGWSNSHGVALHITFSGDNEFSKLHAAIRVLLPILPALSASSPILEGRYTGFHAARMEAYLHAQERYPELMGSLIPEAVFTQEDYDRVVLGPIAQALAPVDPDGLLDPERSNTRGAVVHFDEGVVELRVLDAQECPAADLAIAEFVTVVLKALTSGRWVSTYVQRAWSEDDLLAIFLQVIRDAGHTVIANRDHLLMFGLLKQDQMLVGKLWQHLFVELYGDLSTETRQHIGHILEHGCLATRILRHTGRTPSQEKLRTVYAQLANCLEQGRLFA